MDINKPLTSSETLVDLVVFMLKEVKDRSNFVLSGVDLGNCLTLFVYICITDCGINLIS